MSESIIRNCPMDDKLKERLSHLLMPGEEVRWYCRPVLNSYVESMLSAFPIGLFFILPSLAFVIACLLDHLLGAFVFGLLFLLLGLFIFFRPFYRRRILSRTIYVLTNQRLLKLGPKPRIYPLEQIQHALREHYDDGSGNLLLERSYGVSDETGLEITADGLIDIPDIRQAEAKIVEVLKELNSNPAPPKLIQQNGTIAVDPDQKAIRTAAYSLDSRNHYMMMSLDHENCLWVYMIGNKSHILEYREKYSGFISCVELSKTSNDEIVSMVLKYKSRSDQWREGQSFGYPRLSGRRSPILFPDQWFLIGFTVGSIVCICLAIYMTFNSVKLYWLGKETQGIVVDLARDGEYVQRIIEFKGNGVKRHLAKMGSHGSVSSFHTGDKLTVLYDTNDLSDPPIANIKSFEDLWLAPFGLFAGGCIFGVFVCPYWLKTIFRIKIRERVSIGSAFLTIPDPPV